MHRRCGSPPRPLRRKVATGLNSAQVFRAPGDLLETSTEGTHMASSGKKKTTMAKLNRERKLRERRLDKQAKKDARKQASADHQRPLDDLVAGDNDQSTEADAGQPAFDAIRQSRIFT